MVLAWSKSLSSHQLPVILLSTIIVLSRWGYTIPLSTTSFTDDGLVERISHFLRSSNTLRHTHPHHAWLWFTAIWANSRQFQGHHSQPRQPSRLVTELYGGVFHSLVEYDLSPPALFRSKKNYKNLIHKLTLSLTSIAQQRFDAPSPNT